MHGAGTMAGGPVRQCHSLTYLQRFQDLVFLRRRRRAPRQEHVPLRNGAQVLKTIASVAARASSFVTSALGKRDSPDSAPRIAQGYGLDDLGGRKLFDDDAHYGDSAASNCDGTSTRG